MFKIKRLYRFVISSYIGPFVVCFFISLFVFLMISLWRYIDDLVGKGLDTSLILELFGYMALTATPTALPLSILLSSLMAFGNMGEHLELLSMKAAGISLLRIMKPLIFFICVVAIGAFYFSNNVIPWANNKHYSLLISIKRTSPEMEVPENQFYKLDDYTIKAVKKDAETGTLYNVKLYDNSKDKEGTNVTIADSATIALTPDDLYTVVKLYSGETLADFKSNPRAEYDGEKIPFRRDRFVGRTLLFENKHGFSQKDLYENHYVSMNISQLEHYQDSIRRAIENSRSSFIEQIASNTYFEKGAKFPSYRRAERDSIAKLDPEKKGLTAPDLISKASPMSYDSLVASTDKEVLIKNIDKEIIKVRGLSTRSENRSRFIALRENTINRVRVEWHRKFTLSFACLIFFFIGAPLGALTKKGGIGIPVIISIVFFLTYFIINSSGMKLAEEGVLSPIIGMWVSSVCFFPLGIYFTYKAINDSSAFNFAQIANGVRYLVKKMKKGDKNAEAANA